MQITLNDVVLMQSRYVTTEKGGFQSVKLNEYEQTTGGSNEINFSCAPDTPGLNELKRTMKTVVVDCTAYLAGFQQRITATKFTVKGGE